MVVVVVVVVGVVVVVVVVVVVAVVVVSVAELSVCVVFETASVDEKSVDDTSVLSFSEVSGGAVVPQSHMGHFSVGIMSPTPIKLPTELKINANTRIIVHKKRQKKVQLHIKNPPFGLYTIKLYHNHAKKST